MYNLLNSFLRIQNYENETTNQSILYNFESFVGFDDLQELIYAIFLALI